MKDREKTIYELIVLAALVVVCMATLFYLIPTSNETQPNKTIDNQVSGMVINDGGTKLGSGNSTFVVSTTNPSGGTPLSSGITGFAVVRQNDA